jgi:hypothetical protein
MTWYPARHGIPRAIVPPHAVTRPGILPGAVPHVQWHRKPRDAEYPMQRDIPRSTAGIR